MLQNVAMVEILPNIAIELHNNPRNDPRRALYDILPSALAGFQRQCRREISGSLIVPIRKHVKYSAIEHLKTHQMKMHGMRVFCKVHELPNLRAVEARLFRDGLVP